MPVKMGANLTSLPSGVYVKDADNLVVGQTAENLRRRDPTRYKREFKLDLGIKVPYQMGGCELLPEKFVTEVLRKLKREAQEQSGNGAPLDAAVITVPANYPKNKRELMRQAAEAAGFTRIKLLPEPVADAHPLAIALKERARFSPKFNAAPAKVNAGENNRFVLLPSAFCFFTNE